MRYKDINLDSNLFEVNMSPSNLHKLASAIPDARAGLEFEMCVPGAQDNEDQEGEPDYDQDERCRSIEDACEFFGDGIYNGSDDIRRLRERMQEEFSEWLEERLAQEWDRIGDDYLREWIANNVDEDEWNNSDDDPGADRSERLDNFSANVFHNPRSRYYQDAYEEFREENQESWDESDWLDDEGLDTMSNIENNYSYVSWPHYTQAEEVDMDYIIDSFENVVSRNAVSGGDYHSMGGAHRADINADSYIVERDGSIDAKDGDGGLEFVSPPLTIPEMIQDLKDVVKWADHYGCYTGAQYKTGLHMNISVPNYSLDKLDFLKLTILLGDEHVLNEFGRISNTYCTSAMKIVKDRAKQRPEDVEALLNKMKTHLDAAATKSIHSGVTSKYTSINTKDNRVEFRGPGGDWIGDYKKDPGKLVNTMLRMVVALDAACDPNKYRKEYQIKLYKLMTSGIADRHNKDILSYFSRYVSGDLPKAALKSIVRQAQLERETTRNKPGQKMWWRVDKEGRGATNGASLEVVATSKQEAIDKAATEWNLFSTEHKSRMDAYPVRPYDEKSDATAGGGHIRQPDDAAMPETLRPTGPGPWEVYNRQTGNSMVNLVQGDQPITDRTQAHRMAATLIAAGRHDLYGVRTRTANGQNTTAQTPVGATVGAPVPAGSVGTQPTTRTWHDPNNGINPYWDNPRPPVNNNNQT